MDEGTFPVPPVELTTARKTPKKSGGLQRRDKNSLPRALLVMRNGGTAIIGALVVTAAYIVGAGCRHVWHVATYVPLAKEFTVAASDFAYQSAVSKLRPDSVQQLSSAVAVVGGTLGKHLVDYDRAKWMVLKFDIS